MKILKSVILSIGLLMLIPAMAFASDESNLVKKNTDGTECLDLEAAYAQINESSQALTNNDNGVDALKKAETLATLTNVMSFFVGDSIYCVKDDVAASNVSSFEKYGLLGEIGIANTQMLAAFPSVNVGDHLAQMFIPGYKGNNSTLAQSEVPTASQISEMSASELAQYVQACAQGYTTGGTLDCDAVDARNTELGAATGSSSTSETDEASALEDLITGEITNQAEEAVSQEDLSAEEDTADPVTLSGYNYLKDSLHLDTIWNVTRNLAYLGYIVIVIIIGFMIMFRKNLGGQTVVSLGNSIPNLVIGIILVTFSFAIVGLMLDIGRTGMGIVGNMFAGFYEDSGSENEVVGIEDVGTLYDGAMERVDLPWVTWLSGIPIIGNALAPVLTSAVGGGQLAFSLTKIGTYIMTFLQTAMNFDLGSTWSKIIEIPLDILLAGVSYGLIAALIKAILVMGICLYASFRLFITIIITYFKLFISVILGPIQIMIGSMPGNSGMISNWFKGVVANVLTFVGIYFVINLFNYLADYVDPEQFNFFGNAGVIWPDWLIPLPAVIMIGGYLFAASIPNVINGMLKVEQSKEMASAGMDVKKAASRIPLIGGIFNS